MKLNYGDEIQKDTGIGLGTVHTGIYIGNNQVIHFDGEISSDGKSDIIKQSSLQEFMDGKEIKVRETPQSDKHAKKIVKRAKKIMNNPKNKYNGNYGVLFGENCQDFTQDCYEVIL